MHLLSDVKQKVGQFASDNATTLLTAGGVVGVVATAVLSGRAGYKLATVKFEKQSEIFLEHLEDEEFTTQLSDIEIPKKDLIVASLPELIPPVITGSAAITAIIMSNRMSAQKAAALAAAYGLADRNFAEYKAKVEERLTGQKKTQIDDELAQDKIDRTPGHDNIVVIDGEILCFDKSGGRYFRSTVEAIKQAVNTCNAEIINHGYVTASTFYKEVGLPANAWSDEVGFDMSNLIELTYSTGMVGGNRTCFTFEFKSLPRTEYGPKYSD